MSVFSTFFYKFCLFLLFIFSLPLIVIIAGVIVVTSGFPIFFIQLRTGKNGKPFPLYKFRTMLPDAENQKKKYYSLNEARGPVFKIHNDPRFTSIGKVLSHTGLDELPQFINVWQGDMALIGPRPLPLEETKELTTWQKKRYKGLPGIISPWIFEGYHGTPFDKWMKSDITYLQQKSFLTDIRLCLKFIPYFLHLMTTELRILTGKQKTSLDNTKEKRYT